MGSLKLKKDVKCSNFVQTMYLVPRGKKGEKKSYSIMNDILRIINHNYQVIHHSKLVVSLKSQDIDPRFFFQIHASTRILARCTSQGCYLNLKCSICGMELLYNCKFGLSSFTTHHHILNYGICL
ncbi:hypothetical protein P8452_02462 [Trifolium repens]|nr:hypothetical protein P8452_02462 [Trifolium repens]